MRILLPTLLATLVLLSAGVSASETQFGGSVRDTEEQLFNESSANVSFSASDIQPANYSTNMTTGPATMTSFSTSAVQTTEQDVIEDSENPMFDEIDLLAVPSSTVAQEENMGSSAGKKSKKSKKSKKQRKSSANDETEVSQVMTSERDAGMVDVITELEEYISSKKSGKKSSKKSGEKSRKQSTKTVQFDELETMPTQSRTSRKRTLETSEITYDELEITEPSMSEVQQTSYNVDNDSEEEEPQLSASALSGSRTFQTMDDLLVEGDEAEQAESAFYQTIQTDYVPTANMSSRSETQASQGPSVVRVANQDPTVLEAKQKMIVKNVQALLAADFPPVITQSALNTDEQPESSFTNVASPAATFVTTMEPAPMTTVGSDLEFTAEVAQDTVSYSINALKNVLAAVKAAQKQKGASNDKTESIALAQIVLLLENIQTYISSGRVRASSSDRIQFAFSTIAQHHATIVAMFNSGAELSAAWNAYEMAIMPIMPANFQDAVLEVMSNAN